MGIYLCFNAPSGVMLEWAQLNCGFVIQKRVNEFDVGVLLGNFLDLCFETGNHNWLLTQLHLFDRRIRR
jgi:hypothetical protein